MTIDTNGQHPLDALADAAIARITALAPELDALTDQLQALSEATSDGDEQLSEYLIQAALWTHQLSGTCSDGVAASLRGLKSDLAKLGAAQ